MRQVYLINLTTIRGFEDLSANIKPERMQVFVKKAQELDLKPMLGQACYDDLINHCNDDGSLRDTAPATYGMLMDGCQYQDKHGHQIIYAGIAPALSYFTLARFVEADAIRYTASGPVLKQPEGSQALSWSDTVKIAQQYRSIANAHANEVEKFLCDNKADYPLWQFNTRNKTSRQPGPRIRAIDKTAINLPLDYTDPLIMNNQWQ